MSKNGPASGARDKRRPPTYGSLCQPDTGPHHPCPGGRRPYTSPNRRNFRDLGYGLSSPPCQAVTSTPHFMRRPSDQTHHHESPEGTSEEEEKERRRSPGFRRTPGASRPRNPRQGSGSGFTSPQPSRPGYGSVWDNNPKSFFHQGPSNNSHRMLHASDLCGGSEPPLREDECSESRSHGGGTVELRINNLDYNISAREWKKILIAEFVEHVKVLEAFIQTQADNTNVGYIRLGSIDEARFAISKLHRKKVGYKRIHVSLVDDDSNTSAPNTRSEVVGLLKEVSNNSLPLFKFIDRFEKRYHRGISVSELYRMRTIIQIEDREGSGRTVSLPSSSATPSTTDSTEEDQDEEGWLESPVCKVHCVEGSPVYVTAMDAECLPNVICQLKTFSAQVHTLLQTHDGNMQLMSFQCCHEAEFKQLTLTEEGGVPLEHLISCVPGVKVAITRSGIKKIQWAENKPAGPVTKSSPLMTQTLSQFGREVVDLLKHSPQCRISFVKFIPAYHHHFGRQCRVADYGYTKLMELLEAIPHIVQVSGSGSRRVVMLSHRSQVKRFVADMLRVLKSQTSKQISVTDLPIVYHEVIRRPFSITDYGVCFIEDMLCEVPESTIQVQGTGQEMNIFIPRREQTLAEQERTQQFAVEVIDLLRHSPQCRMSFNKFIPAYHHHFGKQCRVADYGFVKLLDLFESIPNVVQIDEEEEDKMLSLMDDELFKVLADQVTALLRLRTNQEVPVPEFLTAFMRLHGHSLRLQDYGVSSVSALIKHIPQTAKIEQSQGRAVIRLVDQVEERQLAQRVLLILMEQVEATLDLEELYSRYSVQHDSDITEEDVNKLNEFIQVYDDGCGKGKRVKLKPLQMFARDMRTLLLLNKGRLSFQHIEPVFAQHFGVALVPASYGCPSLYALIQSVPLVISLRGKGYRRIILLTPEFQSSDSTNAVQWQSVCNHTPIASPSGDSGITDCHGLSPDHDRMIGGEVMASPVLQGKAGDPGGRNYGHYDLTNEPVPEMQSTYTDELNDVYVNVSSPGGITLPHNEFEAQAQYGMASDYVPYTHDSSYLQPPYMTGAQEAFYMSYPSYDYTLGGQYVPDGATMDPYHQDGSTSPLEFPGEFGDGREPGVLYMMGTPDMSPPHVYSDAACNPTSYNDLKTSEAASDVKSDVGVLPLPGVSDTDSPSLEAASAKLKNLIISAPPPQLVVNAEPWMSDLSQTSDAATDVDVDVNNNASLMMDLKSEVKVELTGSPTSPTREETMTSPDSIKSEGRNDSGCQEDLEREVDLASSKFHASPRKTRLAARFKAPTDRKSRQHVSATTRTHSELVSGKSRNTEHT